MIPVCIFIGSIDGLALAERPQDGVTLAAAAATLNEHRPALADLERIAGAPPKT